MLRWNILVQLPPARSELYNYQIIYFSSLFLGVKGFANNVDVCILVHRFLYIIYIANQDEKQFVSNFNGDRQSFLYCIHSQLPPQSRGTWSACINVCWNYVYISPYNKVSSTQSITYSCRYIYIYSRLARADDVSARNCLAIQLTPTF